MTCVPGFIVYDLANDMMVEVLPGLIQPIAKVSDSHPVF